MGFLSKVRKKIKRQIQPGNMMIGNIRKVPRRPNMIPPSFRPRPFGPGHPLFDPPRMARPVRPGDPVQPRPIFPRRPIEKGYKVDPSRRKPRKGSSIRDAIRRSEQQQFANPTIFGQPIGNFDFGNMPNFSIDDIMEMPQVPTQMPMTQDLPEVSPVGMMPQMRMSGMQDMQPRMMMQAGDEVSFPDLTGDGKVTQADILKGRGVYAEGDEVMMMEETEMMAPGGDEIEASLMEVQGMQPETQMLDQYVQMVIEMVQAGASEAEVIESLRQAGLDDDDIAAVFQAVMETLQGSMEQGGIDAELAQLS